MPETPSLITFAGGLFRTACLVADRRAVQQATYYRTPAGKTDLRRQGRLLELIFVETS